MLPIHASKIFAPSSTGQLFLVFPMTFRFSCVLVGDWFISLQVPVAGALAFFFFMTSSCPAFLAVPRSFCCARILSYCSSFYLCYLCGW